MDIVKKTMRKLVIPAAIFILMAMVWALLPTTKVYATSGSWETENNGSTGTADRISVNNTYYGKTSTSDGSDEYDYYRFTTTSNGYVKLQFNHTWISNADECWRVSLLHSNGDVITTKYVQGNEESMYFASVGLSAGTYYVRIDNAFCSNSDVTYNFKATFTQSSIWETEFNDSTSTADAISANSTYYGNMCHRDAGYGHDEYEYDYYWFKTTTDGHVKLAFNHAYTANSDNCWRVSLLHSNGDVITTKYVQGNEENISFASVGLPAGTYYVRIDNASCSKSSITYNFKVGFTSSSAWETEFNDDMSAADSIAVNKTYYGNMCHRDAGYGYEEYEYDYYRFKVNTKGYATVTFNHTYISGSDEYWRVSLLDADSNEVVSEYIQGNRKSVTFAKTLIPAGTYYVRIDNDYCSNSDVNYNFKVNFASDLKLSLSATKYSYTGKERKPKVTVKYGSTTLVEGTDYTVSYSNNKYPGTATATVTAKGKYIGIFKKNFTINSPAAAPKTVTANLYGYDDFQVKWSSQKVAGYTVKYKVQYKKYGGSWATLSSKTTKTSLKKANLADGARYAFKVTPYVTINNKNYYGPSKSTSYTYTLKKVSKPKISKASKRYVKVKWTNIPGESGYQIYRSKYKNKKFSKVKTVSAKYSSAKIKASRNKTYYYKVRAYKKVGSKYVYGPWSTVKSYKLR